MKTIVAGTRSYNFTHEDLKILSAIDITEVVSGCAPGADREGEKWARMNSIPVKQFPADWSLGLSAGPIRNKAMAEYADRLVAFWDGKSPGTRNMIEQARRLGLDVIIVYERKRS